MRLDRFEPFVIDTIRAAASPAIARAEPFSAAGADRPHGVVIRTATGGQAHLQLVRTSPPTGDDWAKPEQPVTGPVPVRVPVPTLPAGRLPAADLEAWIVALLTNAANPEIAEVRGFAGAPRSYHRIGVAVRCHSGAMIYALPLHAVPAGQTVDPRKEHQPAEVI